LLTTQQQKDNALGHLRDLAYKALRGNEKFVETFLAARQLPRNESDPLSQQENFVSYVYDFLLKTRERNLANVSSSLYLCFADELDLKKSTINLYKLNSRLQFAAVSGNIGAQYAWMKINHDPKRRIRSNLSEKFISLAQESAKSDDEVALYFLAWLQEHNYITAPKGFLRQSAELGFTPAINKLASGCEFNTTARLLSNALTGKQIKKEDLVMRMHYQASIKGNQRSQTTLRISAYKRNNPYAYYYLALKRKPPEIKIRLMLKAHQFGHPYALQKLCFMRNIPNQRQLIEKLAAEKPFALCQELEHQLNKNKISKADAIAYLQLVTERKTDQNLDAADYAFYLLGSIYQEMTLITQAKCCYDQISCQAMLTPEQHGHIGEFYYVQQESKNALGHLRRSDEGGDQSSEQLVSHALQSLFDNTSSPKPIEPKEATHLRDRFAKEKQRTQSICQPLRASKKENRDINPRIHSSSSTPLSSSSRALG